MEEEKNPYLKMRAAKIARNEARLRELGLLRSTPRVDPAPTQSSRSKVAKKTPTNNPTLPLRRSSRHSGRPDSYLELPEPKRRKNAGEAHEKPSRAVAPDKPQTFPPHSARAMDIHVEKLVHGGLLGKMVERTGKAIVMQEAARRSGINVGDISFNKYCGVQEWQNDALFLWVNLGGGGDVINDFLNGGRQITWFGGSRMHEETKVIRRLLRVGKSVENGTNESSNGVVLWCRSWDKSTKSHTPYVCLGRLKYHSHEPGSRPLKFVWSLVDYEGLVKHKDEAVRRMFEELVSIS